MKNKIELLFFLFLVSSCKAQFIGCSITDDAGLINWAGFQIQLTTSSEIPDNQKTTATFQFDGNLGAFLNLANTEDPVKDYVSVRIEDNNLIIETTDKFVDSFEEDNKNTQVNGNNINLQPPIRITCDEEKPADMILNIYVADTNGNDPVFSQQTYSYVMPMPLTPRIDLSSLGDTIYVTDLDFSNKNLTFSVDPPGSWEISHEDPINRDYRVLLRTGEYTSFDSMTFTLTASDGERTGSATIEITKDGELSLPNPPTFSNPIYKFEYSKEDDSISSTDGQKITITSSNTGAIIAEFEDTTYFIATYDDTTKEITIERTSTPIDSELSVLDLLLKVQQGTDSSETVILITIPSDPVVEAPKFSAPYYKATYIRSADAEVLDTVNEEEAIKVDDPDAVVTLEGDYASNFKIECPDTTCNLTVLSDLGADVLETGKEVILVLQATKDGVTEPAKATVIITLPPVDKTLQFAEATYVFSYDGSTDPPTLTPNQIKINDVTDASTVDIAFEGDNSDSFTAEAQDDHWVVSVAALPAEVVDAGDSLVLKIIASQKDDPTVQGHAGLVTELPSKSNSNQLQFSETTYLFSYDDSTGEPTLTPNTLQIDGVTDTRTVTVTIEGAGKEYFTVTPSDDLYEVTVAAIDEDFITAHPLLVLTLTATQNDDNTITGSGGLVVRLSEGTNDVLQFSDIAYVFTYDGSTEPPTLTPNQIKINDVTDATTVDLAFDGDNSDSFTAEAKDDHWEISVTTLPEDVVNAGDPLVLKVTGTRTDDHSTGSTGVVIQFTKETDPSTTLVFSQVAYLATYLVNSEENDDTILLDNGDIKINGVDDVTPIVLEIEETDYQDYFDLTQDTDHWTLVLKKDLPQDVLDQVSLLLTLKAKLGQASSEAGLLIKLPKKSIQGTFSFDDSYYNAVYDDSSEPGILTVEGSITVSGSDLAQVEFSIGEDYSKYFSAALEGNEIKVSVQESLTSEILDNNVVIVVEVKGTKSDSDIPEETAATLVVQLPQTVHPSDFYFKENVYFADYSDDDKLSVESSIEIAGDSDSSAKIALTGEYKDNFKASYTAGKVSVELAKALDDDALKKSAISLQLEATKNATTVKAGFVVKLPKSQSDSDDDIDTSGLIAAVAVLAVLLVASLVGSVVFYYLKFRRSRYGNIDEPRMSERFQKNTNTEGKQKVEHPTRRATGVIKYPLDEVAGETATEENLTDIDRRKSVQFDTTNIDELEIEKPEEESEDNYTDGGEDHEYISVENETADDRRSSRV